MDPFDSFDTPKLKNTENDTVIEINSNPFSIGRGLSCNYVIPSNVVSRVHCVLEKTDGWYLSDKSTNGTYINDVIIKQRKSDKLRNNDKISLSPDGNQYIFQCYVDEISDETLSMVPDPELNISIQSCNSVELVPVTFNSTSTSRSPERSVPVITLSTPPPINTRVIDLPSTSNVVAPRISIVDLTDDSFSATDLSVEKIEEKKAKVSTSKPNVDKPIESTSGAATCANQDVRQPYNSVDMEDEMQCSICSEMFVKATTLNCSHTFCKMCIETWKKNSTICPICRCNITVMNPTLVLDNVIDRMIQLSSAEVQAQRKQVIEERKKLEEAQRNVPPAAPTRGRGNGRTRGNIRIVNVRHLQEPNAHAHDMFARHGIDNILLNVANVMGRRRNRGPDNQPHNIIEVASSSSSSNSSTEDEEEDEQGDSSTDDMEWQDQYDDDSWYGDGVPGAYYGGYGRCFSCGRSGHWSNGCPYR